MANTVWAFATADVAALQLFDAIAAEATDRITDFDAQALANTVWAFAKARVAASRLFDAVAAESLQRMTTFNS
eukprot:CAMPEP_0198664504 /NCGR_PEP_ID=MMETSP1467-20131203/56508_1 /TAXON_ID=1462469 /ORGANISM="unid. sp., Strain CCMP2135" /LENGTH=72 /DNA_ID=CAMNT_0044401071 /DNA_START=1 /DNA_END=215 /DNA_ORIENTATION=-